MALTVQNMMFSPKYSLLLCKNWSNFNCFVTWENRSIEQDNFVGNYFPQYRERGLSGLDAPNEQAEPYHRPNFLIIGMGSNTSILNEQTGLSVTIVYV